MNGLNDGFRLSIFAHDKGHIECVFVDTLHTRGMRQNFSHKFENKLLFADEVFSPNAPTILTTHKHILLFIWWWLFNKCSSWRAHEIPGFYALQISRYFLHTQVYGQRFFIGFFLGGGWRIHVWRKGKEPYFAIYAHVYKKSFVWLWIVQRFTLA
jgi:hypothetical protein